MNGYDYECSDAAGLLAWIEFQSIKIGVFQDESQADCLARQAADIRSAFPLDRAVDLVAEDFCRVVERETRKRLAVGILNFDTDVASG